MSHIALPIEKQNTNPMTFEYRATSEHKHNDDEQVVHLSTEKSAKLFLFYFIFFWDTRRRWCFLFYVRN